MTDDENKQPSEVEGSAEDTPDNQPTVETEASTTMPVGDQSAAQAKATKESAVVKAAEEAAKTTPVAKESAVAAATPSEASTDPTDKKADTSTATDAPPTEQTEDSAPPAPAKLGAVPKSDPSEIDLSSVNALVVEDDAGGMAIIGVMMRFLNIKAYINTTGEGVVPMAKAMRPRPNIVFCDINLPRTNGYEVLNEIRADEDLKHVLVIAVTAQDADTEIPKAREAGFNGYIGKPLNRMRFPKQLRRILAGEEVWETY